MNDEDDRLNCVLDTWDVQFGEKPCCLEWCLVFSESAQSSLIHLVVPFAC